MRLIDADKLYIPAEEMVSKMSVYCAPTIDAIPAEQVARMIANYTNDFPCDFGEGYAQSQKDEFCGLEQCGLDDKYACWLHAIQEGWLDD